ncbi:MAG: glycosyltransferase, partial [Planctomycetota bacterium]
GDLNGLREAVLWMRDHERERLAMAEAGQQWCRERFTAEAMVDGLEQVYGETINRLRGRGTWQTPRTRPHDARGRSTDDTGVDTDDDAAPPGDDDRDSEGAPETASRIGGANTSTATLTAAGNASTANTMVEAATTNALRQRGGLIESKPTQTDDAIVGPERTRPDADHDDVRSDDEEDEEDDLSGSAPPRHGDRQRKGITQPVAVSLLIPHSLPTATGASPVASAGRQQRE